MFNAKTICTVCNYIYDEALGEPRQEILPGKKFEDLAEEWICPECTASKEMFQPCSCVSLPLYEKTCVIHSEPDLQRLPGESNSFTRDTPVGQIVAQHPACACVFEKQGIDYCCGGETALEEACLKNGLCVEALLEKLQAAAANKAVPNEVDWTQTNLKFLISHIVEAYHEPLKLELRRILPLAEKVAGVHGKKHPEMLEVLEIFSRLKEDLEVHMHKEESVLFPAIAAAETRKGIWKFACSDGVEHPIQNMLQEHESAGEALSKLRQLTNSYTAPEDACTTFRLLLASLAQLESEMHQHVHKENNILFVKAAKLFTTGASLVNELKTPIRSRIS